MARKTKTLRIPDEDGNRDRGKAFLLTEMAAIPAEKWAMRAFIALSRSNADIPTDVLGMGWAGLALIGLHGLAGLQFGEAEPLLDEMWNCVTVIPDPDGHPDVTRPLLMGDVEELETILRIRQEVFNLHANFSELVARFRKMNSDRRAADLAAAQLTSMSTSPEA